MIMALLINAIEFATLGSIIDDCYASKQPDAVKARVNFLLSFSWSHNGQKWSFVCQLHPWPLLSLLTRALFSNPMNVHSHNINLGENYPSLWSKVERKGEIFELVHRSHLAPFESFISLAENVVWIMTLTWIRNVTSLVSSTVPP